MTILLSPDWPAPDHVYVAVSTREGGVSRGDFDSLNLGAHVGDEVSRVAENRRLFRMELPGQPAVQWLQQVHGNQVYCLDDSRVIHPPPEADALYSRLGGVALAVLSADCLPVCLTNEEGTEIAIAHAGWRGLAGGVLEAALDRFAASSSEIIAWLGPAIGPCHFKVGEEVKQAFVEHALPGWEQNTAEAFSPLLYSNKYFADLYRLASLRLMAAGVMNIHGGGRCTYCEHVDFYSYRRHNPTGRFATVIGLR